MLNVAVARALALLVGLAPVVANAADPAPAALSAQELADDLSTLLQDGTSLVRLRLEVQRPPGTTQSALQLQIKSRRTKTGSELVYHVLWPKERKGEAVLLRKAAGRPPTGSVFVPPDTVRALEAAQMKESLFGSDLSYEDVIENFFAWEHQAIVGTETVNRVSCQILESKPGRGERSMYASVRTWVDTRRLVPLRVVKFAPSGQLARRIETTRVVTDDQRRHIPANLMVYGSRKDSVTDLDGSRIKHDVTFADREFTPAGLKEVTSARPE
ncbi:MAG: outer membrane lipoprotein-sorting protein [Verrucomicrobiales bacterium]